eukprot:6208856-Pleurochrysis_carterae.AAC.2
MAARRVVVTGGNSGIGLALCKILATDHGCHVYLGSRNKDKGLAAIASLVEANKDLESKLELLNVDTGSDDSVAAAAASVKDSLPEGEKLYALVNNAGTGLSHGVSPEEVLNVNLYGPKRMVDAFLPLLSALDGRIVNLGSGAGPMYVKKLPAEKAKAFCTCPPDWAAIEAMVIETKLEADFETNKDPFPPYGLSKACLALYTMLLAAEHPKIMSSCVSPGMINTAIVKGFGATKTPEEGTVSTVHCLFAELEGNGWFYGSDAVRSPYHVARNPGEPAYDGHEPFGNATDAMAG